MTKRSLRIALVTGVVAIGLTYLLVRNSHSFPFSERVEQHTATSEATRQSWPPPIVTLKVVSDRDSSTGEGARVVVSNLQPISAMVYITAAPASVGMSLSMQSSNKTLPSVELTARDRDSHRTVSIVATEIGNGAERGVERFRFALGIPPDPDFMANRIEKKMIEVERTEESRVREGKADGSALRLFRDRRSGIASALKDAYHENRVGTFEVFARYHSSSPGTWIGTVSSDPVTVQIVHKGEFFDQAPFR